MKGDFPECQKCTSFQCTTCGLDQINKDSGGVSSTYNIFKSICVLIFLLILSWLFGEITLFKAIAFSIAFGSIGAYRIIVFIENKDNVNKEYGKENLITGLSIGLVTFCFGYFP